MASPSPPRRGWRLVTDFRQLKEVTVGTCFPLPFTADILEYVVASNYITAVDLKQGFYQIKMDPADAHNTAFTGPNGCYQYTRMAMGLKDAPITFTRAKALTTAGLQGKDLEIYYDDIMIFA